MVERAGRSSARRLLVGDRLVDSGEVVTGFVVLQDRTPTMARGVDPSRDYVVLERSGAPYSLVSIDHVGAFQWDSVGPDPLDGVTVHELGGEWQQIFSTALSNPVHPWAEHAEPLLREAAEQGWVMFPVGGAIRDLLLGADPTDPTRIDDMDLAGTIPTTTFRQMVYDHLQSMAGGSLARLDLPLVLRTSANQVVHVRRVVAVENDPSVESQPALQYAALKLDLREVRGEAHHLVAGTSFLSDARWRDIAYNDLFYDVERGLIVDPTGDGVPDLGIDPRQLLRAPGELTRGQMRVRVVDPPPSATPELWLNAVARTVKQVRDFPNADFKLARDWFDVHEARFREYVADPNLKAKLESKLNDLGRKRTKPYPVLSVLQTRLGERFGGWVAGANRAGGATRSEVGSPRVHVVGSALAELDGSRPYSIGLVEGPDEPTSIAATNYFANRLSSYEHVAIDLPGWGHPVLALRDQFEFGPTYIELDNESPIAVTEETLAAVRDADQR